MCGTCGCGDENSLRITKAGKEGKLNLTFNAHEHAHQHEDGVLHSHHHHHHDENHEHPHSHNHSHEHNGTSHSHHSHTHSHDEQAHTELILEQKLLSKNDKQAERNRGYFDAKNIFVVNLVSSPGSGKTSLLEETILRLKNEIPLYVIEGDQQTMNDANRIAKAGAPAIQINTGNGCHLEAEMIYTAVKELEISDNSILIIENVGNLVCPAMFDLGETKRVVVISTTEGEDKPLKYPNMFHSSQLCVINKIDLLPYLKFDMAECRQNALKVNHHLEFIQTSVSSGEGIDQWINWLKEGLKAVSK